MDGFYPENEKETDAGECYKRLLTEKWRAKRRWRNEWNEEEGNDWLLLENEMKGKHGNELNGCISEKWKEWQWIEEN